MIVVYKHPRFASYALRFYYHEGFIEDATRMWDAYLDDVLLPEDARPFGTEVSHG